MTEEKMLDDRREQMKASQELAPEGLLYSLGAPWKALENALRNRNFENTRLCDKIACMEETLAALWEIVRKVTTEDTLLEHANGGSQYCIFCEGHQYRMMQFKHESDCIVTKARALIAQNGPQSH